MSGHSNGELVRLVDLQLSEERVGDGVDGERSGVERDTVVHRRQLGHWQIKPHHVCGLGEVSGDDVRVSVGRYLAGSCYLSNR